MRADKKTKMPLLYFQTSETQTEPVLDEVFDWDLSGKKMIKLSWPEEPWSSGCRGHLQSKKIQVKYQHFPKISLLKHTNVKT